MTATTSTNTRGGQSINYAMMNSTGARNTSPTNEEADSTAQEADAVRHREEEERMARAIQDGHSMPTSTDVASEVSDAEKATSIDFLYNHVYECRHL